MSGGPDAFNLSALENALACLYESFLRAQPPLSEALRIYAQLAFMPVHPATAADEIKKRVEGGKMQAHFSEVTAVCAAELARISHSAAGGPVGHLRHL